MKRISLFLISMFLYAGVNLNAQAPVESAPVLNYAGLQKKIEKSDADIQNAKKNTKAKTWTTRAQVYLDVFNVHNDLLSRGMAPEGARLFMKEPKEIKTYTDGSDQMEAYIYDRVNLIFRNGKLDKWLETDKIYADPIPEVEKALDEAVKLNGDGKADADIQTIVERLKNAYQFVAVNAYEDGDFAASQKNFVNILELNKMPVMKGRVDTIIIYFAGRAAYENKDYAVASKLFEETASHNYKDPILYVLRKQALFACGDTASGVEVIREGFTKYPEDQAIMIEMINYYIDSKQVPQALEMISKAKEGDPDNISYYFTEGTLYEKLDRIDEAENAYMKCLEKNPEYFSANYNLGVLHYNKAVKIYEEASKIMDNNAFEKMQKEGDEALKKVIPFMEKASTTGAEVADKKSALETLKTVYYRLKMENEREGVIKRLAEL
ncbi:MAG: tetratricopeptide repeat protein [Bacteroidales bacterium]